MALKVRCPNPDCGKAYSVSEEKLGQSAVCKRCGHKFTLAAATDETLLSSNETVGGEKTQKTPDAKAGKRLGRFEIRSRLGAGGFGAVYRAYDPVLEREVALKVPRAAVLERPQAKARFLREPKAAAQLRHPHIVPIFDVGGEGEQYYIASAYIEGHTLEQVIAQKRPDFRTAAKFICDLADALDYAHVMGVVHRDVKPSNVMIDTKGEALLMDFGLAHLETAEENLTQDGTLMGTPAYMAPEQASRSRGKVGPQSDQYSLGVVMYELLCGQTPFSGPPNVLIFNTLNQEPEKPRKVNSAVPRDLETICLKAMSKGSQERYHDCGALAADVRRWLEGEPIRARPIGQAERLVRWSRRNPLSAGLSAATAALVLIVAIVSTVAYFSTSDALTEAEIAKQRTEQALEEKEAEAAAKEKALKAKEEEQVAKEAEGERARQAIAEKEAEQQQKEAALEKMDAALVEKEQALQDAEAKTKEARLAIEAKEDALKRAQEAFAKMTVEERRAEEARYFHLIGQAAKALQDGDNAQAEKCLADCSPALRHWEWGYLSHLHHGGPFVSIVPHENGGISAIAFAPDGKRIASASTDGTVRVFNATTGRQALAPLTHGAPVLDVAFSPDGMWIASTNRSSVAARTLVEARTKEIPADGTVKVWNATSGKEVQSLHTRKYGAAAIAFSPDGESIASAGSPGGKVWDLTTGRVVLTLPSIPGVEILSDIAFSADGRQIAAVGQSSGPPKDDPVKVWNARTGEELLTLVGKTGPLTSLTFSRHGLLAAGGGFESYSLRNRRTGKATEHHDAYGAVIVWDTTSGRELWTSRTHTRWVTGLDFSPDGRWLASGDAGGVLKIWDATTGLGVASPEQVTTAIVAFSPDGRRIASANFAFLTIWDATMGREVQTLRGHTRPVTALAYSVDGKRIATASADQTVKVWDVNSGQELLTLQERIQPDPVKARTLYGTPIAQSAQRVSDVAFSPDGMRIASAGCHDKTVKVWDAVEGHVVLTLQGHTEEVRSVDFSSDGKWIASASDDKTVKVWDATSGKEVLTLGGNMDRVRGVVFSPDSQRIVSATRKDKDADGEAKVWDVNTGQEVLSLSPPPGTRALNAVTYSN